MKIKFPDGFFWGAAASGPQTESNTNKVHDSNWDLWFKKEPSRFFNEVSSSTVCDTYHKYKEDVQLMKDINFNSFRTSIQWSRFIKDFETCSVDEDALRFYNAYIDEMIAQGIEPVIGLYHFDMPALLQETYGGFESKHVVDLYVNFARKVFEHFGNRVKYFSTFNEPMVPVEGGYLYNFHYPDKNDPKLAVQVAYNTILAHSKVAQMYHDMGLQGEIGVVLNLTPTYTQGTHKEDALAVAYADAFFNRSFLDPILKGTFPKLLLDALQEQALMPTYTKDELTIIKQAHIDFLGVNYYVPRRVRARTTPYTTPYFTPEVYFEPYTDTDARFNPFRDNNEIKPCAIYDIAMNIKENYGNIRWFISEIGIAMDLESEGEPVDGVIDDRYRIGLLKEHLVYLAKAIDEGANCFGVHMWTFIDNWSWLNSFKRRYGFYRLDLETNARIIKKSGLWMKELAKNNYFLDEGEH